MFDDYQTPVLDLENLSFMQIVRGNGSERCAALPALIRLMNDDPVRGDDLLQSYACVTDLTADL